jgi:translation initiation factor IF-2
MPSKVPSTKTASSKSSGSKAPARTARGASSKTTASKSPARGGRGSASAKVESKEPQEPKKPVIKTSELPTLSLIDEPAPRKRVVTAAKALPRIGEEEHAASTPAPVPEPEETPVAEEAAPASEDNRKVIHIKPPIQIKELAAQMEVPPFKIIKDLMGMQIFANINQSVEPEIASKLCELYGFVFEREKRVAGAGVHKEEKVVRSSLNRFG